MASWIAACAALLACAPRAEAADQAPDQAPLDEAADQEVTGASELFAEDPPATLVSTEVHLDDVPVRGKSGNGIWVGFSARRQIFVVPIDPSFVGFVKIGATVDVRGTVRETPSASQAAFVYAMDRASAERLADDRFYIDAWTVSYVH